MSRPRSLCFVVLAAYFAARILASEAASPASLENAEKSAASPASSATGSADQPVVDADAGRTAERAPAPAPIINIPPPDLTPVLKANAELAARLDLMQQLVLSQRDREAAIYRDTNRLITIFGISFAAIGVAGLVGAGFLNYRALRTAQLSIRTMGGRLALPGAEEPAGDVPGMERIRNSGQRFQARMSALESRLAEMENLTGVRSDHEARTHASPPAATVPVESETVSETRAEAEPRRIVPIGAILVHKAEALLNLGKLDDALATLDQAERTGEVPGEVQLARGRVLERMGRLGDALKAYDLAVVGDERNTSALLMKAGVLNRQERFAEALACYERALELHRGNN